MPPIEDTDDLRRKLAHAEAVIVELREVVADLRRQVDARQAHIHRLVKMTFGRSSERVDGPTLFDGLDQEADPTPTIAVAAVPNPKKGRRFSGAERRSRRMIRDPETFL
jgi:uncharacterized coiled-coil protein SlyX